MGSSATKDLLTGDRKLLDGFRRGDRDALSRVFRHYADDVTRTLRAGVVVASGGGPLRVGAGLPDSEIEALVQDVFLKAFGPSARESYDGQRPFGAWLSTITRNALVDHARRSHRHGRPLAPAELEAAATRADLDPQPAAPEHLESTELDGLVADAVAQLDELDQRIYRARYQRGLSLKEAAAELKLPIITLRRRDARVRQRILQKVKANGYLEHARVRLPAGV